MASFRWTCTALIWVMVASPRLWALGSVLLAVGCTLGLLLPVWWIGLGIATVGMGIAELSCRVRTADPAPSTPRAGTE
ncbi:hypothetical protein [Kitasatospora sp. KL5]|uniref:hypothetical protein n=1 Tax=Kitasatospora sp. KL5 TaxID=3425125 RepID=UPI003D6F4FFB